MRYLLIPDLHGRGELLEGVLAQEAVPATARERVEAGVHVVQLGDLVNGARDTVVADIQICHLAGRLCDTVLVGNHDFQYMGGPEISGFFENPGVATAVLALTAKWKPCLLVSDVLLTHAGATDEWGWASAADAAEAIKSTWAREQSHPIFSQIGMQRGGGSQTGGIIWSDFHEPRALFRQIHGHTPIPDGPGYKQTVRNGERPKTLSWEEDGAGRMTIVGWDGSIDLDVGAGYGGDRIVAAWLEATGAFSLAEYHAQ